MPTMHEIEQFFDSDMLLNKTFLRNSVNEAIHLNSRGLIEIASIIKSQINNRYPRKSGGGPKSSAHKAGSGLGSKT